MIRRISSIKNFGIYTDFKWNNIPDFNDKNIIYGWNYCGKTTLSRLFKVLSQDSKIAEEYKDSEFSVELKDEKITTLSQNNIKDSPLLVEVFNSDFIKDNLHFDTGNNNLNGIAFDIGEESGTARDQLKKVQSSITSIKNWLENNHQDIDSFNEFETILFTQEAKKIKNNNFESAIEFTKAHLKRVIDTFTKQDYQQYIINSPEELKTVRADALAREPLPAINVHIPNLVIVELRNKTEEYLHAEPKQIDNDAFFSQNHQLYEWGKQGLAIYQQHPDLQTCAFCGNPIEQQRIQWLNAYYTNEAATIRTKINELVDLIQEEIHQIKNIALLKYSPNDIVESCKDEFKCAIDTFNEIQKDYIAALEQLIEALKNKLENSLFVKQELPILDDTIESQFDKWMIQIKEVIQKHNTKVDDFSSNKRIAIEKYKCHLVAQFLLSNKYYLKKELSDKQVTDRNAKDEELNGLKQQTQILEAQLKSLAKGKEQLNKFIQLFLTRDDILVDIAEDSYFVLKRGNKVACNLSEGEKTAIAFAYFLVSLDSLKVEDKLQDRIIFIDDPISSLDANHIAQVSSLINSFFFFEKDGKIENCFKQLFIATHNFEFYSFLRDANNIKRKKTIKDGNQTQTHKVCNFYMLKRFSIDKTELIKLPKSFYAYNSEYIFLFDMIFKYRKDNYPEDNAYMMPNVVRRFLEIYTLIKLPGNTDEIDKRVKILIGDVNELKILHYFSHFTTPERITKHTELILKMPEVVDDIFTLLKQDQTHLASLCEGIGEKVEL